MNLEKKLPGPKKRPLLKRVGLATALTSVLLSTPSCGLLQAIDVAGKVIMVADTLPKESTKEPTYKKEDPIVKSILPQLTSCMRSTSSILRIHQA